MDKEKETFHRGNQWLVGHLKNFKKSGKWASLKLSRSIVFPLLVQAIRLQVLQSKERTMCQTAINQGTVYNIKIILREDSKFNVFLRPTNNMVLNLTTVVWLRIYDSAEEHPNHLEMTPLEMGQLRHSDENIGGCVYSWWDWLHWKWDNPLLLKGIGRAG